MCRERGQSSGTETSLRSSTHEESRRSRKNTDLRTPNLILYLPACVILFCQLRSEAVKPRINPFFISFHFISFHMHVPPRFKGITPLNASHIRRSQHLDTVSAWSVLSVLSVCISILRICSAYMGPSLC